MPIWWWSTPAASSTAAVEESLDAIGEALAENGKVIVTGCLGAKGDVVKRRAPEVLAVTGPHATDEVMDAVHAHLPKPHDPFIGPGAAAGHQAHAEALRLSEDFRRLQPSLHLLHHPVHARRPGQPSGRRGDAGSGNAGQGRREGTAGDLAGHQRLRRGREIPHRLLGRPAAEDAHDRTGAAHLGELGRLGAPALRLSRIRTSTKSSR